MYARYKLAQYYLREFTEINLFSKDEKVPLPKLYVAMKWKRYRKDKRQLFRSLSDESDHDKSTEQQQHQTKELNLAEYRDVFEKVLH